MQIDNMKRFFNEKYVIWFASAASLFHIILGLLRHFTDVTGLYPLDHALILVAMTTGIIHLIISRVRFRFGKAYLILLILFLWYLLSCQVMTDTYGRDWFSYNRDPLFDFLMLSGLVFPLGIYMARKGFDVIVGIMIHALFFVWTGFMLYILIHVFQNRIINLPSGGQIGMNSEIALCLNTHYNTTGVIEFVMLIIAAFFIFTGRSIPLRIAYGASGLIHMAALALSNSRTALLVAAIFFGACVFGVVFNAKWNLSLFKRLIIGTAAAVGTVIFFILFRRFVYSVHENITHLQALLHGASETNASAGDSAARDLTSMESMNERFQVWQFALQAMVIDAKRFFFGVTPVSVISVISDLSGERFNFYSHNQFLEIGVSLGVPGMLLFVLFVALLAKYSFQIAIRQNEGLKAWVVISAVVTLLLANMTEATLMFYRFLSSYAFFLFSGWICGTAARQSERKEQSSRTGKRRK